MDENVIDFTSIIIPSSTKTTLINKRIELPKIIRVSIGCNSEIVKGLKRIIRKTHINRWTAMAK